MTSVFRSEDSEHSRHQRKSQHKKMAKLPFTRPLLRPLGSLLHQTKDGGTSKEYDSYDKNRS